MDHPHVISPDGVAPEPWANGGGLTRVLHHTPQWRVSVATITEPGPFSPFTGWDRLFVPLGPSSVELTVNGVPHTVAPGTPAVFRGEDTVSASPASPSVHVVNIMARRRSTPLRYRLWSGPVPHPIQHVDGEPLTGLVVLSGSARIGESVLIPGTLVTDSAVCVLHAGADDQFLLFG